MEPEGKQRTTEYGGATGLLVGSAFSRPFSTGCHSPSNNNRFRGSLDCVLNAWQVEACYAKSAQSRERERERERKREREKGRNTVGRQTRRLCLRHPACQERISFLSFSFSFTMVTANAKSARADKAFCCNFSDRVDSLKGQEACLLKKFQFLWVLPRD